MSARENAGVGTRPLLFCGIDVGLQGAIAFLADNGGPVPLLADVIDMPTLKAGKKTELDSWALAAIFREHRPNHVMVELVHAMPGQGVSSMFSFGRGFGVILGVLAAFDIPYTLVSPQAWQKAVLGGLPGAEGKGKAIQWAAATFPDAVLQTPRGRLLDGRADALALAYYGFAQARRKAA